MISPQVIAISAGSTDQRSLRSAGRWDKLVAFSSWVGVAPGTHHYKRNILSRGGAMTRAFLKLAIGSTLLLSPLLGGCAVAVVGGVAAAGGAGYETVQGRGINGTFDDMHLQSQINNALNNRYGDIAVTVYAGTVLLTGSSPTPQAKVQAEQVARTLPGTTAVYNEIAVAPNEDPMQIAKDDWITARIRSDLMFDPNVHSPNYTIETDRQSVYLMGVARSRAELDRATQLARYVPGVQRVVSYVQVASAPPNGATPAAAQPGPPMASGNGASSSSIGQSGPLYSAPAPANAPIQVEKLD